MERIRPKLIFLGLLAQKLTFGALAFIGATYVLVYGFEWFMFSVPSEIVTDDTSIIRSFPTPNHEYKAVIFNQNGGGAWSPYCIDYLSVVPGSTADKDAWGDKYSVFIAGCGSLSNLKWISEKELQITFDADKGVQSVSALTLKGYADHGKVSVSYLQTSYILSAP